MLEWFTTIPGILIICGVILLIIAIILFIAGSKKSKVKATKPEEMNSNNENITPVVNNDQMVTPITPVETVNEMPTEPEMSANIEMPAQPEITISEPSQDAMATPAMEMPTMENQPPVVEIPSMEPVAEPEITMPSMTIEEPTVTTEVETTTPAYGMEQPVMDFSVNPEKPVTIYGGNDPLDATQTLPKVEEHHEPYSGNYQEARVVEPTPVVEPIAPVEDVVTSIPTPSMEEPIAVPTTPIMEEVSPVMPEATVTIPEEEKTQVEEL